LAFYVAADNLARRRLVSLSKPTNAASLRLLLLEASILQRE